MLAAIKKMAKGKSPGPDSLPAEFYQAFGSALAPILTRVLQETRERSSMPETMRDGEMTVPLREGPPSSDPRPQGWRPRSGTEKKARETRKGKGP